MIQRQAQVDEVRWSRLQTELASTQNLSVMIFTTFTVIFLPLSFFTSLFGMNTAEWSGGDDDDNNYPTLGFIGAISCKTFDFPHPPFPCFLCFSFRQASQDRKEKAKADHVAA